MPSDVPIRCSCGALRGVARGVPAARDNRLVCYCDDCQSFAHFLGDASHILDAHGGSEVFQMTPARLEITAGAEHLACMRLTERGLLRWYADCCRTPIGNTLRVAWAPFVGVIHSCLDTASLGRPREEVLGPIRARVNARFAKGDRAKLDAYDLAPASLLLRFARMLLVGRLRGEHAPSPFFEPGSGKPRVRPTVLSAQERRRVEAIRDAA